MQFDSICAREIPENRSTDPHILPIYATSAFSFQNIEESMEVFQNIESGHVYSRYANPTVDTVAKKIAALETFGLGFEADAILTSSGMAAISTLFFGLLNKGDKVLTQGNLYGGSTELLKAVFTKLGIEPIFINLADELSVEKILAEEKNIKAIYCETPANPTLACLDLEKLSEFAHAHSAVLAVDNTFASPYLQQPFKHGADFIIHSTTKYINGHGNSTAGVIIGREQGAMRSKVWNAMKLIGTNCSPFEAWLTHNGMKTLALRMERHSSNALAIAEFLEAHHAVKRVNYPGLLSHPNHALAKKQMRTGGGMLSFELKGGMEAGIQFMNRTKMCSITSTLGNVDTLALHPASSSHLKVDKALREQFDITDGLVRLSIGIEHPMDLLEDIEQAL